MPELSDIETIRAQLAPCIGGLALLFAETLVARRRHLVFVAEKAA